MSYKLYYFDARGLAEPIRMILSYGGAEFEDVRAPMDVNKMPPVMPAEIKEKCTWGQVPVLEVDGRKLVQSLAITRYVAKQFNLVPKDDLEAALCDEYVDASRDLMTASLPVIMEKDEAKKPDVLAAFRKTADDRFLSKYEAILKNNGGERLVGKALSWADIYVAHVINQLELVAKIEILKDYPELKKLSDSVFAIPQIKSWVAKRPETVF